MENIEVRMLNGITDVTTPITDEHVKIAKEILRRKFVVGIFEWFDVGMVRFEKFFGWWERYDVLNNLTINECHSAIIESGGEVGNFPKIDRAEEVYSKILSRSWADVELYHYAKVSCVPLLRSMKTLSRTQISTPVPFCRTGEAYLERLCIY